jgi:hypothetical protein
MQQPPKKRAKPLGKAIQWSDADLEQLAHISEADKKAAEVLWKNEAPVAFRSLLDAQVQEDTGTNA